MAKFIKVTTKLGKMLVNLDCVDAIHSNQDTNETVISFAGTEEYICVNEKYDEIVSKIKTEEKKTINSKNATIFDYARMCNKIDCDKCKLNESNNGRYVHCEHFVMTYTEEANDIILEWTKAHPVRTQQQTFLGLFPKTVLDNSGIISINPCDVHSDMRTGDGHCAESHGVSSCAKCREQFWLSEADNNESNN